VGCDGAPRRTLASFHPTSTLSAQVTVITPSALPSSVTREWVVPICCDVDRNNVESMRYRRRLFETQVDEYEWSPCRSTCCGWCFEFRGALLNGQMGSA